MLVSAVRLCADFVHLSPSDEMDVDIPEDMDIDDIILDEDAINKIVEDAPEIEALTSVALKRMLISFERAFTKNQQQRVKYAGSPERLTITTYDLFTSGLLKVRWSWTRKSKNCRSLPRLRSSMETSSD